MAILTVINTTGCSGHNIMTFTFVCPWFHVSSTLSVQICFQNLAKARS